ncbi:HK97-gp10 family putative phage morphogenesis protein [Solimicrobium silvestre]|uniref:Phage protein, HK97 gp10 family n=1 Tax=Solimicrobium silvestre TaxID=2099400 RepID=A0A2S9GZC3_9BURK|nr:HK97-gp10 family putative phage morphogenesis protein [Solimicrobium silvestre]PRC93085.1 Phage protein, HK97 gp10 family [Solimicrobium silvestre]
MANFDIEMSGDLFGVLTKFESKVREKVLFSGAAAMAKVIYDEAKINALKHTKSGTLYDAIYRVHSKDKSTEQKVTYEISWNKTRAPHGHLIEFGTVRAPAYPFIRPAFDRISDAIKAGQDRMREALNKRAS